MEHLIPPEEIKDYTIVNNYIYAFNNRKCQPWIIHSELPYRSFCKMIDYLIDMGFTKIRELEIDEFAKLSTMNSTFTFVVSSVGLDRFLDEIIK